MNLPDIISIIVIAVVIGGAVIYIIKAKKHGQKCIGCPNSRICSKGCSSYDECKNCNKKQ